MSQFLMPSLGADMESAVLMEWLVNEGESVKKGQAIAAVETSKAVIEIEVFEDGIVEKFLVEEGTECKVGTPLAVIKSENEELKVSDKKKSTQKSVKEENTPVLLLNKPVVEKKKVKQRRIEASPSARKKAKELGVDLEKLASKIKGKIKLKNVEEAFNKKSKKSAKTDSMRQAIAAAMSLSNAKIPHYYLSTSINMTPALEWLEELNTKRSIEERILPAALLIRAISLALGEVPELNGFWIDDALKISQEIHPGIAIALRSGGVITPALLNSEDMNLDMMMKSLSDLITRTRSGKLRNSEMTKQTITITNLGDLGVESVYGVIYPPEVAIVGLGRISDKPWVEKDKILIRKVIQVSLAGDHRATDGRVGALFLEKLNNFLQTPGELI